MVSGEDEQRKFDLFQENIIEKMQDREFFVDTVIHNYIDTAYQVGLRPMCSVRRTNEAYFYWQSDLSRTLREGIEPTTTNLDHFKHASFIAFWLRRVIPINEIKIDSPRGVDESDQRDARRMRYFKFGNELSAFLIGYKLCINYEAGRIYNNPDESTEPFMDREDYLLSLKLPEVLLDDYLMLWKHKNMSPYALYMLYKSLFARHFS